MFLFFLIVVVVPIPQIEDDIEDQIHENNNNRNNEVVDRGPRAIAMRILKHLMANWYPNYIDGDQ